MYNQWRAPSLERGVSRVGKLVSGDPLHNYVFVHMRNPEHPVGDNGEG